MATIRKLSVTIDDDDVLATISEAIFGATDGLIDPALYEINAVILKTDSDTGERQIDFDVVPKP